MRRKIGGLASPTAGLLKHVYDPTAEMMKWANPTLGVMNEIARHQKMMEDLVTPHHATNALLSVHSVADRLLQDQTVLRTTLGPTYDLNSVTGINSALVQEEHQRAITRAVMGPFAELRATGALAAAASEEAYNATRLLTNYEDKFRIATSTDFHALAAMKVNDHSLVPLYRDNIIRSTQAVVLPFICTDNPIASISAFAELQSITRAITLLAPFDERLTSTLRADLGDWRDPITFPPSIYGDVAARTTFYADRGLRLDLTDFPAAVFEIGIEFGETNADGYSLVDLYGEPIESLEGEDISAFIRTNEVQGWFLRFEGQIRVFIEQRMVKEYGTDWPRLKLTPLVYQDWKDKSGKAAAASKPDSPLILFADFTDYESIICNKGHWKLFKDAFKVNDAIHVRESFQRLYLPRVEASHGRMLTQDDYLFAYSELKRLGKAIKSGL